MSLIGLVRQAINGQASWEDVEKKAVALAENGALDVLESAEQLATSFWTAFAPAEAKSLSGDVPGAVETALDSGVGAAATQVGSEVLSQTETNAAAAAGNALAGNAAGPNGASGS